MKTILEIKKGFTMMETMITIVIVGILAAIAVPVYNDYVNQSRCGYGLVLVNNAAFALHAVANRNNGVYPDALPGGIALTAPDFANPIVYNANAGTITATRDCCDGDDTVVLTLGAAAALNDGIAGAGDCENAF